MKRLLITGAFLLVGGLLKSQSIYDLGKIYTYLEPNSTTETYLSSEDIQATHSSSLKELLEKQGYQVMSKGGQGSKSEVSINGYTSFCIKVYVDGQLANNPATGEFDWNQLDLSSIESITISEVPLDNQFQFAGTSISIKTRAFSGRAITLSSSVLSYQDSIADTVSIKSSYKDFIGPVGIKFNLSAQSADNRYGKRNLEINEDNWSKGINSSLSWIYEPNNLLLGGSTQFGYNTVKAFGKGSSNSVGIEKDYNLISSAYFRIPNLLKLNTVYQFVGIEYSESQTSFDITKVHQFNLSGDLTLPLGFSIYSEINLEHSQEMSATRFQFNSKLINKLTFGIFSFKSWLGLQWQIKGTPQLLPGILISCNPVGLSLSVFREYILPTFNQLYYNGSDGLGNPNLNPESGWSGVLSWCSVDNWVKISIQSSYYKDKIRWSSIPSSFVQYSVNLAEGLYFTSELSTQHKFKYFEYFFSYNYTKAMLIGDTPDKGNQIMWVPEHKFNVMLKFGVDWLNLTGYLTYVGKRYDGNENTTYMAPYWLLNISLFYRATSNLELNLNINNVLDERYLYHEHYSAPSRSISVSVNLKI